MAEIGEDENDDSLERSNIVSFLERMFPGPYLKTLKHVHTEQVARLQAKNQHECDLLEDIRNFTKQRSVIEKTYAEALLKVSSAYLNKKIPSIPDLRDEDEDEKWNVWNVWRTVLEENEKLARARLAAVEVFQQQITDDAKTIRQAKLQASRKCLEQLQTVQKELQVTVGELDRNKKFYFEEEHMAHDARVKASDAEEKLKKKKGSIFSSFTSLQRSSVKLSSKKETCEEKSTGARNEYIMALAQANAHQDRYYNNDMDTCLRTLEGDVYEKLKEYLTVLGRTELLTCSAAQNSFSKIRDQAQMLSRDYNVACCVQYYPVLKQNISYPFEPCDGDHCRKITTEHASAAALTVEAKNWANRIGKQVKLIRENQRKLRMYLDLKEAGHKSDPDDPNGPDIDIKLDELRENIRRGETDKLKAESVIFCFRDAGINVDEFMKDIETLSATPEIHRSSSSASIKGESIPEKQNRVSEVYYDSDSADSPFEKVKTAEVPVADSPEPTEVSIDDRVEEARQRAGPPMTWDDPTQVDWGDEPEVTVQEPSRSPPADISQIGHGDSWPHDHGSEPGVVRCVALYSYTAQNPDELTILENEHLDLLGEGDGDGWVRARNYKGEEGYVPQNYVEVEGNTPAAGYPLQPQISFSSVDYHVQDSSHVTDQDEVTVVEDGDANGITNGYPEDNGEFYDANLPDEMAIPTAPTTVSSGLTTPFINECRGGEEGNFCRALYDYEATAPEELTFGEGQIIRITKYTPHDEEDGWWEGEYEGQRGLFPSIVCDECHWDGEPLTPTPMDVEEEDEELSESAMNPPAYTPPQIPEGQVPREINDNGEGLPDLEDAQEDDPEYENDRANFEMELNLDQQQKYQTQFDEQQCEAISVVVTEVPDIKVEITVTEPEPGEGEENTGDASGDGLEVTQIVITAATPMSEEHKSFPGGDAIIEESEEDLLEEEGPPLPKVPPPSTPMDIPVVIEQDMDLESEGFADFSAMEDTPAPVPQSSSEGPSEPLESAQIADPDSKSSCKSSLDMDENRFLRGESKESLSPVTPDELELHNLAKLETLKESDA